MSRPFPRPMSFYYPDEIEAQERSEERLRAALCGPLLIDDRGAYAITYRRADDRVSQKRHG